MLFGYKYKQAGTKKVYDHRSKKFLIICLYRTYGQSSDCSERFYTNIHRWEAG